MFVCIVMEFYKNGDLERVLKQRRQTQQPIEELVRQDKIQILHFFMYKDLWDFYFPHYFPLREHRSKAVNNAAYSYHQIRKTPE